MKLWIDADAAPREVKEICFRASERLELDTVLVANQRIQLPPGYRYLSAVRVDGGPDVADNYIVEHAQAGDVAVTQDIPLGNGGRISADVSAKYSSSYFVTDYISGTRYVQPKYTRTDVKLGYFAPQDKWYVQAYGENLENKRELGVVEVGGFSLTNPVQ